MFLILSQTRNDFPVSGQNTEHLPSIWPLSRTPVPISKLDKLLRKSLPRSRDRRSQGAMLGQGLIIIPTEQLSKRSEKPPPMAHTLDIQNPGDWLFDTSYMGTCSVCNQRFCGPKRARTCWEHTPEPVKTSWVGSFQEPMNPPMEPSQMVFPFARFDPPSDR